MTPNRQLVLETLTVVAIYAVVSILWILFSDGLLALVASDTVVLTQLQGLKGIAFVLISAVLLYFLILRLQLRVRQYDQRYQVMFENTPLPMWIFDLHSLRILLVNDAALVHYGYSRSEFLELSIDQLRPPEDVPAMQAVVSEAIAEGVQEKNLRWRHRKKDGTRIFVEIDAHRFMHLGHDAALVVARDITKAVEAEASLRLQAAFFDYSRFGVMICDHNRNIIAVNAAFETITGFSQAEVLGKNPRILSSGHHDEQFYREMWETLYREGHWQGEIWNRRKNGQIYPESLSLGLVRNTGGEVEKFIGSFTDISSEKDALGRIEFLSWHDPLTNLPNRALLRDRLKVHLASARKQKGELTLLMLDLDHFKHVNDVFGTEAADRMLIGIAGRLVNALGERDTVARGSGDEFLLLVVDRSHDEIALLASSVLGSLRTPFVIDGQEISLTVSMGIARFPANGDNAERLLQCADSALFRMKEQGRNGFQFFAHDTQDRSQEFLRVESGLQRALANGELQLFYQGQYDTNSGVLKGAEALVRWQHPGWGMVAPGRFIPVAEESGLIIEIGQWILKTAVEQQVQWRARNLPVVPVAVNISVVQFRRPGLYEYVRDLLEESGLPPQLLWLEITESIAMENIEFSMELIGRFRGLGVRIALDDFGSGYSSLSYLKRLNLDKVKIDQSFINDLERSATDAVIVRAVVELGRSKGFVTVAEGVETGAQLRVLRNAGCDEIQGYLFSRPQPAAEFGQALLTGTVVTPDAG